MKPKSLMLLGVSGTFGLIAAALLTKAVGNSKSNVPKEKIGEVVIAVKDIEINTLLTKENCKVEKWPISIIPPHAVRSFKEILNKRTTSRISQKAPISKQDLHDRHNASKLPVPEGMVMYGITAPAEDHHNGLLQPGHLVNVIGIYKVIGLQALTSKTVVRRARVLAINAKTSVDGVSGGDSSNRGKITVSIGVSQNQATLLGLIAKSGTLKLSILGDDPDKKGKKGSKDETTFSFNEDGIVSSEKGKNQSPLENLASSLFGGGNLANSSNGAAKKKSNDKQIITVISGQDVLQYEWIEGKLPKLINTDAGQTNAADQGTEVNDYGNQTGQEGLPDINSIPPDARNLD